MKTTTDNTMRCLVKETLSYKIEEINSQMAALDAEHQNLVASEDWLGQMLEIPVDAEYKGNGAWLYRGRGIFAVPRDGGGKYEDAFDFLAQSDRGPCF